mmetsp:Transcript_103964/g.291218  ORF Transcript_103964/g.291218 Transcript_103964/m.291218 type:complete len:208 (-) Transcript_103964:527-1150(-)
MLIHGQERAQLVEVQLPVSIHVHDRQRLVHHLPQGHEAHGLRERPQLLHRDLAALVLVELLEAPPELLALELAELFHEVEVLVEVHVVVHGDLAHHIHDRLLVGDDVAEVPQQVRDVGDIQVPLPRDLKAAERSLEALDLLGGEAVDPALCARGDGLEHLEELGVYAVRYGHHRGAHGHGWPAHDRGRRSPLCGQAPAVLAMHRAAP